MLTGLRKLISAAFVGVLLTGGTPVFGACLPIRDSETLKASALRGTSACLSAIVAEGSAARLSVTQGSDLILEYSGTETRSVDSFEFGPETVTLTGPGTYRIVVRSLKSQSGFAFSMSREPVSLQEALRWREAELLASQAKKSLTPADIEAALKEWEQLGDRLSAARERLQLGDARVSGGRMEEALHEYERALSVCEALGDNRCAAEAANNSGFAAQQSGAFEAALAHLNAASEYWRKCGELTLAGRTLSNLGLLYWQMNDFARAIDANDRAAKALARTDRAAYARVLNNLGLCYQSLAEYRRSGQLFEKAIGLEAALPGMRLDLIHARVNEGRNLMLTGKTPDAGRMLQRAATDARTAGDRRGLAHALCNLGQNFLERMAGASARAALEESLGLYRTLSDKRMELACLTALGKALAMNGDEESARADLSEAVALGREYALPDATSEALYSLALVHASAGRGGEARGLASQALDLLDSVRAAIPGPALRASFYTRKRRMFDLLVALNLSAGRRDSEEQAFLAAERGRARSLMDILRRDPAAMRTPELAARRESVNREIGLRSYELSRAGARERQDELRARIDALISEDEVIQARMNEAARLPVAAPVSSFEQLREVLPPDCAVLEYYLAEPASFVFVAGWNGVHAVTLDGGVRIAEEARHTQNLFARALDRRRDPRLQAEFETAMRRLSSMLLWPLRDQALPSRLIIVPDGALNRVAFAALRPGPRAEPIGLTHDLIQAPSASFLRTPLRSSPDGHRYKLLAIADPVYSRTDPRMPHPDARAALSDLARLPFRAELDLASRLIPASRREVLTGFASSVASLRAVNTGDFDVLHFSAHALIDDLEPELSHVALSMYAKSGRSVDGALHPFELSQLRLNGSAVVLSGCRTALGRELIGEGVAGLSASLFAAGASQLVLSLADADAEASSDFFAEVYRRYFAAHPDTLERSLTLARRALARSSRWSDPYYWASFVLVAQPESRSVPLSR